MDLDSIAWKKFVVEKRDWRLWAYWLLKQSYDRTKGEKQ